MGRLKINLERNGPFYIVAVFQLSNMAIYLGASSWVHVSQPLMPPELWVLSC